MKKIVCISSTLLLIQLCMGANLGKTYSEVASISEKYSDAFLEYCMSHLDYKIKSDCLYSIARGGDHVFNYTNRSLLLKTDDLKPFINSAIAYFESAYNEYKALPSHCESCIDIGNHPHRSYKPEEEFLFRFILKICEKPAI